MPRRSRQVQGTVPRWFFSRRYPSRRGSAAVSHAGHAVCLTRVAPSWKHDLRSRHPTQSVVPGFSVHDELRNLVDAGRSSYQAIRAATSDAAEFLNSADRWGTVKIGARADLILKTANPLEDVRNVSRRAAVMQASLKRLAASDEIGLHLADRRVPYFRCVRTCGPRSTGAAPGTSPNTSCRYQRLWLRAMQIVCVRAGSTGRSTTSRPS